MIYLYDIAFCALYLGIFQGLLWANSFKKSTQRIDSIFTVCFIIDWSMYSIHMYSQWWCHTENCCCRYEKCCLCGVSHLNEKFCWCDTLKRTWKYFWCDTPEKTFMLYFVCNTLSNINIELIVWLICFCLNHTGVFIC